MAVMTRTQFAKSLQDGLNTHFGMEYDQHAEECTQFLDLETSQKAWEEDQLMVGLGYAQVKAEGAEYAQDSGQEGWTKRYVHRTVGLSFLLTEEAIEDNRYMDLGKKYARALARSMRQTKEVYAANVLNNATTSGVNGGDGVVLLSASHPTQSGVQSNILASSDLSETTLESLLIQIRQAKDDRGLPVMIKPRKLIVPPNNEYNAGRILGSKLRTATADNDINVINAKGIFGMDPTVVTNLTDTDCWFVKTDCPDGLKIMQRTKMVVPKATVDDATGNIRYVARERYSEGWTDWRGVYGSMGAP